jgi:hypothetical protein
MSHDPAKKKKANARLEYVYGFGRDYSYDVKIIQNILFSLIFSLMYLHQNGDTYILAYIEDGVSSKKVGAIDEK